MDVTPPPHPFSLKKVSSSPIFYELKKNSSHENK
jgi:hypothetical protein